VSSASKPWSRDRVRGYCVPPSYPARIARQSGVSRHGLWRLRWLVCWLFLVRRSVSHQLVFSASSRSLQSRKFYNFA
jgi:hypothetical protein